MMQIEISIAEQTLTVTNDHDEAVGNSIRFLLRSRAWASKKTAIARHEVRILFAPRLEPVRLSIPYSSAAGLPAKPGHRSLARSIRIETGY